MPKLHRRSPLVRNSIYHIIVRGVNRRRLFKCDADFAVFIRFLTEYLQPKELTAIQLKASTKKLDTIARRLFHLSRINNYSDDVELLSYALMTNHIHLQLYQKTDKGIQKIMQSLCSRYAKFFCKKYGWIGTIYQDRYRRNILKTDEAVAKVSRYIHRNPMMFGPIEQYKWSSYKNFKSRRFPEWIKPVRVNKSFKRCMYGRICSSYYEFVEDWDI